MPTANPTLADLTARLEGEGLTVPVNAEGLLNAAIEAFETLTGYTPFLGAQADTDWTYDPPKYNEFLSLEGGFWEVTEITVDGATKTLGTDFNLWPLNAEAMGVGWTGVRWLKHPGSKPASIIVSGKRGYAEEMPWGAFEGILAGAKAACMSPAIAGYITNPTKIRQGSVEISGEGEGASKAKEYYNQFMQAVLQYVRIDP